MPDYTGGTWCDNQKERMSEVVESSASSLDTILGLSQEE